MYYFKIFTIFQMQSYYLKLYTILVFHHLFIPKDANKLTLYLLCCSHCLKNNSGTPEKNFKNRKGIFLTVSDCSRI